MEIIADMMEKDPSARMQTAAEVCLRLEPWASDSVALPSQPMTKSPWMPPPLPTGREDLDAQDTNEGPATISRSSNPAGVRASGPRAPIRLGAAGQDTLRIRSGRRRKPPLALVYPYSASRDLTVPVALAVSIPVSLLVGIVLGFLISSWLS